MMMTALPAAAEPGTLELTISGVRSDAGHVLVAVCDRESFLQPNCAYRGRAPAAAGLVTVVITGIPPGVYAAQAYQDENDNRKIDRNFFGIPTEGLGFSNDAPIRFGPPSFDAAAFTLGPEGGRIGFKLRYFN